MSANDTYLNFPFKLGSDGGVATADADRHIRQRLEQVLFTAPGERVMLPQFGCGVRDLIFASNNKLLAAATELMIARALQQNMGNTVMVNSVEVTDQDAQLQIQITYTKTRDLQQEKVVFQLMPFQGVTRGLTSDAV